MKTKFKLTGKDIKSIKYLGLFGSMTHKQLKTLTGITKSRLKELVEREYLWKPTKDNPKTYIYDNNGEKILLYILKKKGISTLKKYYPEIIFTRSRSLKHDYLNIVNLINYATVEELDNYQSEKHIRNSYSDMIKLLEDKFSISISCPDGYFIRDGKKVFVETLNCYSKNTYDNKRNFIMCLKEGETLVILRFGKEIYNFTREVI